MGKCAELPQISPRVDYWLLEWARWLRAEPTKLGYPHHINGIIGGGESRRTDEWEEDEFAAIWMRNCQAMDALISDLSPPQACAVRHIYGGDVFPDVFRFRHEKPVLSLLEDAAAKLLIGMNARVII